MPAPRARSWSVAVALVVGAPAAAGLLASGIANRLTYLGWGVLLAAGGALLLPSSWRRRRVGVLLCAEASAAAVGIGLLHRLDGGAFAVGLRAVAAPLELPAAALPEASWLFAVLFAGLGMGVELRRRAGGESDGRDRGAAG